jgi:hypothetical protein
MGLSSQGLLGNSPNETQFRACASESPTVRSAQMFTWFERMPRQKFLSAQPAAALTLDG